MIIVGLGNPGHQYALTRHNLGFLVVEHFASAFGASDWKTERGVRWTQVGDHFVIEPYEYMNDSGQALRRYLDWRDFPLEPSQLLVVHDDLDFPLGTVKLDRDRSAGGHRGVQSIIDTFKSQNFKRLRLGIGSNRDVGLPAEAYVLQPFTDKEKTAVEEMIAQAVKTVRQVTAA